MLDTKTHDEALRSLDADRPLLRIGEADDAAGTPPLRLLDDNVDGDFFCQDGDVFAVGEFPMPTYRRAKARTRR